MSKQNDTEEILENINEEQEDLSQILKIRREKYQSLVDMGKDPYEQTSYLRDSSAKEIMDSFDDLEGKDISIAGRIVSWRDMGKASFMDIQDQTGRIQLYVRQDNVGEEIYNTEMKNWDIGDIIGVRGEVFRTRKGEISVKIKEVTLLSKSLQPLPEKWHGLKDTDLRYRNRYVDLIVNPDVRETFKKRTQIINEVRNFLNAKGFLEVETPTLSTVAGGAAARPFITHHNTLDVDMYLRVSPELYLKRLIVGGFEKVYEIGKSFRNEGMSIRHNPEFTMLELYEAYTDYNGMMDITEEMIREVTLKVLETTKITYGDTDLDVGKPFKRVSMVNLVKEHSGVDFEGIKDITAARAIADAHKIEYGDHHGKGDILNFLFERYCEEKLIEPTFVTDYPVEISPLSKRHSDKQDYTERFELFILGREYANAFSELNDPIDQRDRFEHQSSLKVAGEEEAHGVDYDFVNALEYAMPPTGGMGIGIDRLVMLLTNSSSIRDVLLFPTMRSLSE